MFIPLVKIEKFTVSNGSQPIFPKIEKLSIFPFVDALYDPLLSKYPQSYLYSDPNPKEIWSFKLFEKYI